MDIFISNVKYIMSEANGVILRPYNAEPEPEPEPEPDNQLVTSADKPFVTISNNSFIMAGE